MSFAPISLSLGLQQSDGCSFVTPPCAALRLALCTAKVLSTKDDASALAKRHFAASKKELSTQAMLYNLLDLLCLCSVKPLPALALNISNF